MGYLSIVKVQSWVWEVGPMLTDDDPKKKNGVAWDQY